MTVQHCAFLFPQNSQTLQQQDVSKCDRTSPVTSRRKSWPPGANLHCDHKDLSKFGHRSDHRTRSVQGDHIPPCDIWLVGLKVQVRFLSNCNDTFNGDQHGQMKQRLCTLNSAPVPTNIPPVFWARPGWVDMDSALRFKTKRSPPDESSEKENNKLAHNDARVSSTASLCSPFFAKGSRTEQADVAAPLHFIIGLVPQCFRQAHNGVSGIGLPSLVANRGSLLCVGRAQ